MELVEFITRLSHISSDTEEDRYWRVIVNLFFVEGIEEFNLGTLPSYFKQYYKRAPVYNGKLLALILEPRFKTICQPVRCHTTLMVQPSEMVLKIISGQFIDLKQTERLNNNTNNISSIIPNNTNVPLKTLTDSNVNLNPFKELAKSELEEKSGPNEFEQFGELALEEMNCCICLDLLKNAVEASCCSGLFCSECINQTIRQSGQNCPLCRAKNAKFTVNEPIRRLIRRKRIKCTNEKCPDWSTLGDIEKHRAQCEFELVKCFYSSCGVELIRKLIKDHESECECRMVGCRHCKREFKFAKIKEHESQCNQRPITCQKCHKSMLFHNLKSHNEHLCEMALVQCTLLCGSAVLRKNMNEHVSTVCPNRRVFCNLNGCSQIVAFKNLVQHREEECLGQLTDCPLGCNMEISKRDVNAHLGVCVNLKIPCPHAVNGCEVMMLKRNPNFIKMHSTHCRYKVMTCPNGCGQKFKKHQLKAHESRCEYSPLPCDYCDEEFPEIYLEEHEKSCDRRPVPCTYCNRKFRQSEVIAHAVRCPYRYEVCHACAKTVYIVQLDHHRRNVCPKRRVECPRCAAQIFHDQQDQHSLVCPDQIVSCSYCKRLFKVRQVTSHEESCPERPARFPCDVCLKQFSLPDLMKHLPCPEGHITCKSCGEIMMRKYLRGHEVVCKPRQESSGCTVQ